MTSPLPQGRTVLAKPAQGKHRSQRIRHASVYPSKPDVTSPTENGDICTFLIKIEGLAFPRRSSGAGSGRPAHAPVPSVRSIEAAGPCAAVQARWLWLFGKSALELDTSAVERTAVLVADEVDWLGR